MAYQVSSQTRWLVTLLAFALGMAASLTVLWLALRTGDLTRQQFEILRIVLALAGGGVGAVIPGFLDVNLNSGGKLALRTGGAVAVFAVLYFWSPARWQPIPDVDVTIGAPGEVASQDGSNSPLTHNDTPADTPPGTR